MSAPSSPAWQVGLGSLATFAFDETGLSAVCWAGLPPQLTEILPMAKIIEFPKSRFAVGEVVQHRLFDYRGVILDVDPTCQASDQWYETVARSRPPKDKPWYHVLVHGASHTTYVAQRHLERDVSGAPIKHPLLDSHFTGFESGRYVRSSVLIN